MTPLFSSLFSRPFALLRLVPKRWRHLSSPPPLFVPPITTKPSYVGNKSAVFPLQLLGLDVDPVNSVQFSNHTGYSTCNGDVLNGAQLLALIDGLERNNLLSCYTHLLTGYIGSASFLQAVVQIALKLKQKNPDLIYVCDPVLGDEGKIYVPEDLVEMYKTLVLPVADVLTPNQFEAEMLTGIKIQNESDAQRACLLLHAHGPRTVVVTSASLEGGYDALHVVGSQRECRRGKEGRKRGVCVHVLAEKAEENHVSSNTMKCFCAASGGEGRIEMPLISIPITYLCCLTLPFFFSLRFQAMVSPGAPPTCAASSSLASRVTTQARGI